MIDLPPVRDCHGRKVWRVKLASVEERTCMDCGKTTTEAYCIRCAAEAEINLQRNQASQVGRRLVPTLSYLRENEYERT